MEATATVRDALFESVNDVEPDSFRAELDAVIETAALSPGVLTIRTARTIDPEVSPAVLAQRAAGVVLSYEGLALTRQLAHDEPWATTADTLDEDLALLVAEVLTARGFYELAPTGVATDAVEIARRFGRNQTNEHVAGAEPQETSLEYDALELAVATGVDLVLEEVPEEFRAYAQSTAATLESRPLPDPTAVGDVTPELEDLVARTAVRAEHPH